MMHEIFSDSSFALGRYVKRENKPQTRACPSTTVSC